MAFYQSKGRLVIAVDDTDTSEEGGTGHVARVIADRLSAQWEVWGVTRHQLAVLPQIPFTARNSVNVVHLLERPENLFDLTSCLEEWLGELAVKGSKPGFCIAPTQALLDEPLGYEAKQRFVERAEIWEAAQQRGVVLRHLWAAPDGIVGAFAGACLAAQGNDGRFVQIGRVRDLSTWVAPAEFLAAGGDEVRSVKEEPVTEGLIWAERLRPALREGRCILYCVNQGGFWKPVKGALGDEQEEVCIHDAH
ncbi:MAG: hypothetical protein ACUVX8_00630 [Candidatus Zipacnadales bacterium]